MNLRQDKKNYNRFWYGPLSWNFVDLLYPITKIDKNIIFTVMGDFEVFEDFDFGVRVKQILTTA